VSKMYAVDEVNDEYDRRDSYAEGYDDGIAAAFAHTTPVVDFVWCEHSGMVVDSLPSTWECGRDCPGPHHTLLIRTEVKHE
jgi:hypothetical protein